MHHEKHLKTTIFFYHDPQEQTNKQKNEGLNKHGSHVGECGDNHDIISEACVEPEDINKCSHNKDTEPAAESGILRHITTFSPGFPSTATPTALCSNRSY